VTVAEDEGKLVEDGRASNSWVESHTARSNVPACSSMQ
jgi:hypothetical protein